MNQDQLKEAVARAAMDYVLPKLVDDIVVGIGTGSTANYFIDMLAEHKGRIFGTVASSEASAAWTTRRERRSWPSWACTSWSS